MGQLASMCLIQGGAAYRILWSFCLIIFVWNDFVPNFEEIPDK